MEVLATLFFPPDQQQPDIYTYLHVYTKHMPTPLIQVSDINLKMDIAVFRRAMILDL